MRVVSEAAGQGVGRALLQKIVAEARACGYRRLSLETGSGAEFAAALRLYERAGFRAVGRVGGSDTLLLTF